MTRKHYIAIADELARLAALHGDSIPTSKVIDAMASVCAASNPAFRWSTFRDFIAAKTAENLARWAA